MLQNQCPDGTQCPNQRCCPRRRGGYGCCRWGRIANCCPDRITCCPRGWLCLVTERECVQQTYSSVLRVQAAVLVNSTDKRCRDGTAGMDLKSGRSIPSQQVETALKTSVFITIHWINYFHTYVLKNNLNTQIDSCIDGSIISIRCLLLLLFYFFVSFFHLLSYSLISFVQRYV